MLSYCGELVRGNDPDRFLISLFVPHTVREDIWALLAFNHEISKTREVVSDSALGHIRLQWWRDAIKGIYEEDSTLEHEVIKPLYKAIKQHHLPREWFDRLIYAREFDLENVAPANIDGFLNYADFTSTPLMQLITKIEGAGGQDADIIKIVGIQYTVVGLLRSTPHLARQGRWMLPQDLSNAYALSLDTLFEDNMKQKRCELAAEILSSIHFDRVKTASSFVKAVNALAQIYAKQIYDLECDICDPLLLREPNFKALKLFWKTKCLCL